MPFFLGATAVAALCAGAATAEPAIIFDLGGKFDKSFNEAAFAGAERWAEETGGTYREIELQLRGPARAGPAPHGRERLEPGRHRGLRLCLDAWTSSRRNTPTPTSWSSTPSSTSPTCATTRFAEHEGSYLVGMMAAMASETGTVGFVGGMDIPLIRKFACGYVQGVKAVNPDATVIAEHDRHHAVGLERPDHAAPN